MRSYHVQGAHVRTGRAYDYWLAAESREAAFREAEEFGLDGESLRVTEERSEEDHPNPATEEQQAFRRRLLAQVASQSLWHLPGGRWPSSIITDFNCAQPGVSLLYPDGGTVSVRVEWKGPTWKGQESRIEDAVVKAAIDVAQQHDMEKTMEERDDSTKMVGTGDIAAAEKAIDDAAAAEAEKLQADIRAAQEEAAAAAREVIDDLFTYHPPDDAQRVAYEAIRESAKQFALTINEHCPPSADRSTAMRKVREAVMTANASVALKGKGYR